MSESQAIATAIAIIKRWASGSPSGGAKTVHPDTVAAAQKALAEWEALKAAAGHKTSHAGGTGLALAGPGVPFNSSLHPRASSGSPTGGQFVVPSAGGGGSGQAPAQPTRRAVVVPPWRVVPSKLTKPVAVSAKAPTVSKPKPPPKLKAVAKAPTAPKLTPAQRKAAAVTRKVVALQKAAARKTAAAQRKAVVHRASAARHATAATKKATHANAATAKKTAAAQARTQKSAAATAKRSATAQASAARKATAAQASTAKRATVAAKRSASAQASTAKKTAAAQTRAQKVAASTAAKSATAAAKNATATQKAQAAMQATTQKAKVAGLTTALKSATNPKTQATIFAQLKTVLGLAQTVGVRDVLTLATNPPSPHLGLAVAAPTSGDGHMNMATPQQSAPTMTREGLVKAVAAYDRVPAPLQPAYQARLVKIAKKIGCSDVIPDDWDTMKAAHTTPGGLRLAIPMVSSSDGPHTTVNGIGMLMTPAHITAAVKAHNKVPPAKRAAYRKKVMSAAHKMGAMNKIPTEWMGKTPDSDGA